MSLILSLFALLPASTVSETWSSNRKYIWIDSVTDWFTAESYCNTQYGTFLASIHSSSDNTEISNLCSNSVENACYIGFNDQTTEGTFLWSDGSAVGDYDPPSFPRDNADHGGYDEDCVIVFDDGIWGDTPCHTSHPYSFICNAPQQISSVNGNYIWINIITDWFTAESHCNTQYGTSLASIHSSSDNTEISNLCSISAENACYIGFNDQTTEGTFLWSDGSVVGDYDPPSFPRDNSDHGGYDEDCVIVFGDGMWGDTPCHTSHPYSFICNVPIPDPSADPTASVTRYMNSKSCDNLEEHFDIKYENTLTECDEYCEYIGDNCVLFNYFKYFKTDSDSRCYIFNKLCDIKEDGNNNTIIGYRAYQEECIDYPLEWTDSIGDSCGYYESYNWCKHGNVSKDEDEFINLMDSKYGKTAMEACCECGGGIYMMNDVAFSYDNYWIDIVYDVSCSWTESNVLDKSKNIRNWNNLILFSLCNNLNGINCEYLVEKDYEPSLYSYSLFLCNSTIGNNKFILNVKINDMDETHDTYINLLWFELDLSYYSSHINIDFVSMDVCMDNINIKTNDTYNYGVHPCYVLDTDDHSSDILDDNFIVIVIVSVVCGIVCVLICIGTICLWKKNNNGKKEDEAAKRKQLELNQMYQTSVNAGIENDQPSAPPLNDNSIVEKKKQMNNNICILCCDGVANVFNDPCGHVTYCRSCTENMPNGENECPSCRQSVRFKQLYNAGFSES